MAYTDPEPSSDAKIGVAGWIALIVLVALLLGAIVYAVHNWNAMAGTGISPLGWLFMSLGVVVTLLVGGGLMALLFYSSRNNYDR